MTFIANLWSAYLDNRPGKSGIESEECHNLTGADVALLMALMKIARMGAQAPNGKVKRDSAVDTCGYIGTIELMGVLSE